MICDVWLKANSNVENPTSLAEHPILTSPRELATLSSWVQQVLSESMFCCAHQGPPRGDLGAPGRPSGGSYSLCQCTSALCGCRYWRETCLKALVRENSRHKYVVMAFGDGTAACQAHPAVAPQLRRIPTTCPVSSPHDAEGGLRSGSAATFFACYLNTFICVFGNWIGDPRLRSRRT